MVYNSYDEGVNILFIYMSHYLQNMFFTFFQNLVNVFLEF